MGCFSWIFGKRKKKKPKKMGRKGSGGSAKIESPCKDELPGVKTASGGCAFEVKLRPATAKPPLRKHTFVENLIGSNANQTAHSQKMSLRSAEERAILANVRRLEEMVRKGESAKEADRRREICLEQKAEQERQFVEKAKQTMARKVLPDKDEVEANMKALQKRCKTARTRRKVAAVFNLRKEDRGCGEGAAPSSSSI